MFVRVKGKEPNRYLQIVENRRQGKRTVQRVLATLGRVDRLAAGGVDALLKSLNRFATQVQVIDGYRQGSLEAGALQHIGPDPVFGRLWLPGTESLGLHHLYRAMRWLGDHKDAVEESLFRRRRDLFIELSLAFFDTTSIYFEGQGGESLGQFGYSKDHRPDRHQLIVRDLLALAEVEVRQGEHWYHLRTALQGIAGKVLQATGIKIPSPVRPRDENVVPKDTCAHITI